MELLSFHKHCKQHKRQPGAAEFAVPAWRVGAAVRVLPRKPWQRGIGFTIQRGVSFSLRVVMSPSPRTLQLAGAPESPPVAAGRAGTTRTLAASRIRTPEQRHGASWIPCGSFSRAAVVSRPRRHGRKVPTGSQAGRPRRPAWAGQLQAAQTSAAFSGVAVSPAWTRARQMPGGCFSEPLPLPSRVSAAWGGSFPARLWTGVPLPTELWLQARVSAPSLQGGGRSEAGGGGCQ